MNKKKKIIIGTTFVLSLCLLVVVGAFIYKGSNKDVSVVKKNISKETWVVEKNEKNNVDINIEEKNIRFKDSLKTKANKTLRQDIKPKNVFNKRQAKEDVSETFDGLAFSAKVVDKYSDKPTQSSQPVPHWVHNHENGIICKSCSGRMDILKKNIERVKGDF